MDFWQGYAIGFAVGVLITLVAQLAFQVGKKQDKEPR